MTALTAKARESGAVAFDETHWSVVLGTRRGASERPEALQRLCAAYWLPVYGYLRRRGHDPADAEDLTQGFFTHLLDSDFLERPDPAKGRFRGYLVGALRHYLGGHFEQKNAQKRGGGASHIDWQNLDAEGEFAVCDQPQLDPSEAYEKTWALTLLARAYRHLENEQRIAGKARQLTVLQPFLSTTPTRGDYEAAAAALGTTRTNVAVWVHRLNYRYAELVKLEVAATVRSDEDIPDEMQHLAQVLRR